MARGLARRCPACGKGRLFESRGEMRESCESCGLVFFQRPGEWTGALMLGQGFFLVLGLVGFVVLAIGLDVSVWWAGAWFGLVAVVLPLALYRNIKGLWVAILFATGASKAGVTSDANPGAP